MSAGIKLASVLLCAAMAACSYFGPPPLEEQKRYIADGQFHAKPLMRRAFLELWGQPMYEHVEQTEFYHATNGGYVPSFRLEMGDAPPGWDGNMMVEVGDFWGYPDRGELLGFVDDELVYREQLSTQSIHALAKKWKYESQFKTRLEVPSGKP